MPINAKSRISPCNQAHPSHLVQVVVQVGESPEDSLEIKHSFKKGTHSLQGNYITTNEKHDMNDMVME